MGDRWLLGPYRALNHRFVVEGEDAGPVRARLEHALAPLEGDGEALDQLTRYRVQRVGRAELPRFKVLCGTRPIATDQTAFHAAGLILWHVNQSVVRADRGRHLLLHGAGAEVDGVLVLLLAASGTGKTTTVAGLLLAGHRYLTDEAVALERSSLRSVPFPKALALNADVMEHFPLTGSGSGIGVHDAVRHVTWSQLGSAGITSGLRPGLVVALRRPEDVPRSDERGIPRSLSPAETAMVLTAGTFEFERRRQRNMRTIAQLAQRVPGVELEISDVRDSVEQITSWVGDIRNGGSPTCAPSSTRRTDQREIRMSTTAIATDGRYTPTADLTVLDVGDEAVVMNPRTGVVTRLNASSRVVWGLLDGEVSLDQTVHELSDAYGVSTDSVRVDVLSLVAELVRLDLVRDRNRGPAHPEPDDEPVPLADLSSQPPLADPVPANQAESGPTVLRVDQTACYRASAKLGWSGIEALRLGDVVLGVRTDSERTAEALRALAHPWIVDGYDVDANLSIRAPRSSEAGRRRVGLVYRGCTIIGRHRDLDAAVQHVVREAALTAAQASPTSPYALINAAAIVPGDGTDRVVLAPPQVGAMLSVVAGGPQLLATAVALDPDTGDVLTPVPPGPSNNAEDPNSSPWRRLRVVAWMVNPGPGRAPADSVMAAVSRVTSDGQDPAAALRGVASMVDAGVQFHEVATSAGRLGALLTRWFST